MNLEQASPFRSLTRRVLLQACMAALGIPACFAVKPAPTPYGTKVRFSKGVALHFLNFDLTYLGTRKEASKVYPHGFTYEDFRVSYGAISDKVSWSAGTGLIAPRQFKFGGNTYQLMLMHGGSVGKLKSDELVVIKL